MKICGSNVNVGFVQLCVRKGTGVEKRAMKEVRMVVSRRWKERRLTCTDKWAGSK